MMRAVCRPIVGFGPLSLVLVALTVAPAAAQTYSWNNFAGTAGGGNLLWSTTANWNAAPTFGQDTTLAFNSSGLQSANNYATTLDSDVTANSLVFNIDGNAQGAFNGAPMIVNLGAGATAGTLRLASSSTAVAPSIVQNGSGSVVLNAAVAGSSIAIEGTAPLRIGGTGTGLLQINAPITAGPTSGTSSGLLINFDPSAIRANHTGASVALGGANTFTGDVVLQNGNLGIGTNTALGVATNRLIVNAGSNSVRATSNVTVPNPVLLNSTMTFTSFDGATSTWTGAWSGTGGVSFRPSTTMTFNYQGPTTFTGSLVARSFGLGASGNLTVTVGSSAGGATNGSLATTDIQLFPGSFLTLTNANANATRLAAGTNLTMYRSAFSLVANASVNAAETVGTLTNTGMSTILAVPSAGGSSTLTFGSWTRQPNATAYFLGTGLGGTPAANVANIVFTTNPGGATPGSTTPGTQNLAVLPYAFTNAVATVTTNAITSLARYDAGTGRIVPLNTATEYADNGAFTYATAAAGLNYRFAGSGTGGVANTTTPLTANGIVLDSNMTNPAPPVGVSMAGPSTVSVTGPILSTVTGTGFPTGLGTFLPNQIAVGGLAYGATTAYVHTQSDLWMVSPISGTAGLVKSGDPGSAVGTLALIGNNSALSGGLTVNAAFVSFETDANLGAAGAGITLNSGANGGLSFTPNQFYTPNNTGAVTVTRPLALGVANGGLGTTNVNNTMTYAGTITGAGGLGKFGGGIVVLDNAANSFSGDVVVGTGTLVATSDGALGAAGNRVVMAGGATLVPGPAFTSTNRDFLFVGGVGPAVLHTNGVDFTINGQLTSTQTGGSGPGLTKVGLGTLTLTAANTLGSGGNFANLFTIGEANLVRSVSPKQAQIGGGIRLSGLSGSLAMLGGANNVGVPFGIILNDAAFLTLDNSAGINNDRIGSIPISLGGGAFNLIGNATANATELTGALNTNSTATITLSQPASAGGQVTTLNANGLNGGGGGTVFVRGTNLGAASGDRTQLIVTPAETTTALPLVNGLVIGGFAAASDSATGPTDFLATTLVTPAATPNVARYSLAPLTTYGTLAAPGATVTANQAGAVFALTGATDLNALRIGAGGGLDLNGNTLTLGTATVNQRAGAILAAGGANSGIVGGTIDFGTAGQPARIVTSSNLTIGTAASPTTILGSNPAANSTVTSSLVKSGPGTLTLFGTGATTLSATSTFSGTVTVAEGSLVLGNATALGRSTLNTTATFPVPVPNVFPSAVIMKGATLDLAALSAAPVRVNTIFGAGNLVLGDTQVYTGNSSSNMPGNITGSANSKYIVGIPQADIPFNIYGGGGPALTGDNSGFLGQWQVLRGTLNFASNLSFGTGTSPIQFSDSASNGSTGSVSLRIDQNLTVPFPRDVQVPAGGFALPTFLVGNSSTASMTGNVSLGKAAAVVGSTGSTSGIFTFAGSISGPGQLILANAGLSGSAGNIAIAGANPNWSGGVLMTGGGQTSTVSSILAVGADNSLGTGTLTLGQFSGLLRADNGLRTLANAIDVTNTTPTAAFTTSFGSTGVNDLTLNGNVRGVLYQQFNFMPPAVPATSNTHTLSVNAISRGTTTFAGTIGNGAAFSLGITKNGPGLVALIGNNSYTGNTVVNAGTVRLGNENALGFGGRQAVTAVDGRATLNPGAILDLNGQTGVNKPITLAGGSLLNNSASPASLAGGTLSSLTLGGTLTGLNAVPTVTLTGGGGTGATAVASLGLASASLAFTPLTQGGSGYSSAPTVTISGGGGSGATAVATLGVTSQTFTITNGGTGYTAAPTVSISSSGTSGATTATATATLTGGVVTAITITNPGTGYLFAPTITFSGGTPTVAATAFANATNFQVGSVALTNPGSGFNSTPTVALVGGTSGTTGTVSANGSNFAMGLQVTNPGSGYTSAPTVGFSGGTATATANLSSIALATGTTSYLGGSGNLTINAPIAGSGNLTKIGSGTANLNGANTYTGATTIAQGSLGGTGTVGGNLTIQAGGSLAPGSSIGTIALNGNTTLNPGAALTVELGPNAGGTSDRVSLGAASTFNFQTQGSAPSNVSLVLQASGFTGSAGGAGTFILGTRASAGWLQVNGATQVDGTILSEYMQGIGNANGRPVMLDTAALTGLVAGDYITVSVSSNNLLLSFTPVPEPTTVLGLSVLALAGAGYWRRRRAAQRSLSTAEA